MRKKRALIHKSPAVAPSSAVLMGGFGNRLFEQSEFPIAAH